MCYSEGREGVVWVKSGKITKAGIISRHFISHMSSFSTLVDVVSWLVHVRSEKHVVSASFNM